MPGNRLFTDFQFRRDVLTSATQLEIIGPLKLNTSRELWRRRLYFGIIWTGFIDWEAEAEITLHDGGAVVQTLRSHWGTIFRDSGASVSGWGGLSRSWRTITPGFPSYSVETWSPPDVLPNWGPTAACVDSSTQYGVQQPDGVSVEANKITMFPFEFVGPVEEVRFEFKNYEVNTIEATAQIEVFLACKSFKV